MGAVVLRRNVADQGRSMAAWTAGLMLLALMYMALYPTIHASGVNIQQLLDQMPKALRDAFLGAGVDYNTPAGYLGTELFALVVPIVLLVVAIVGGSRALAGEESGGTIDLLLSTPLARERLVIEKAAATALPVLLMAGATWVLVAGLGPAFGLRVDLVTLAAALTAIALMALGFGQIAMLVAGATGHRGLGAGAAGALAVASYALNAVAPSVSALKGVDNAISPFHWTGGPGALANGVPWNGMVALLALAVAALVLTAVTYERRDLGA